MLGNVRVKDELIVDRKKRKQEKTGFKINERFNRNEKRDEKRLRQSMQS